jgi:hypothetical protein
MESAIPGQWAAQFVARLSDWLEQSGICASRAGEQDAAAEPPAGTGRPGWSGHPFVPPFGGPPWMRGG